VKIPEQVKMYAEWHKAAYGWNPFEPVECGHCGEPVHLIEVYRCYDCKLPMHRECCIAHCKGEKHGL